MRDIVDRLRIAETSPLDADGKVALFIVLGDAIAEITRLREERRWIPVAERLPDGNEWVDVAGPWGDSFGWHEPSGWRNVDDDPWPCEVTHWRKRGPGPGGEVEG